MNLKSKFFSKTSELSDLSVLIKGSGTVLFTKVAGIGLVFIYHLLLTRYLGSSEYGIYVYAFVISGTLSMIGQLGINRGGLKFMSGFVAKLEYSKLKGVIYRSHQIIFLTCILLGMCTFGVIWILKPEIDEKLFIAFVIVIWRIPLNGLMILRQQVARSFKSMSKAYIPDQILLPILCALAVYILHWMNILSYGTALISYILCSVIILITGWLMVKKGIPKAVFKAKAQYNTVELMKVSLPLFFASFMLIIFNRIDLIMLGPLSSVTATGIYNAAVKIAKLSSFPIFAINAIATPMIAGLYYRGETKRLEQLLHHAINIVVLITIPIVIVSIVLNEELLSIFGEDFKSGSLGLIFLVAANFINASCGTVGALLTMCGQQNAHAKIFLWTALTNVALNLLLIPKFSISGAAIATLISTMMLNVWMVYIAKKRLNIKAYYFLTGFALFFVVFISTCYYFFHDILGVVLSTLVFLLCYSGFLVWNFVYKNGLQKIQYLFSNKTHI